MNILRTYLTTQLTNHHPRDKREALLTHLRSYNQLNIKETIKVANEVSNSEFLFQYKWDMEKTQVSHLFKGKIDWSTSPNGDPEWCYMLNRHRYWVDLGRAFWLTGDEKYIKTYIEQISDWIDKNIYSEALSSKTWRTIEIGMRCEIWLEALSYFIESPILNDTLLFKIIKSFYEHGCRLEQHFTDFSQTSNWGIIENKGLYVLATVMDCFKQASDWRKISEKRLTQCIAVQVYSDGLHWEQSSLYHNEVLKSLISVIRAAYRYDYQVSQSIKKCVLKMAVATLYQSSPLGYTPLNGDSDLIDARELLSELSLLLDDSEFKYAGLDSFGYENIWTYGLKAFDYYIEMSKVKPLNKSYSFRYAHQYVMRSDWHEEALFCLFTSGALGGGHGHADLLHFDLTAYGRQFLVDGGRYTYRNDSIWRETLKSAKSHNTIIIDDQNFNHYIDTWSSKNNARGFGHSWLSNTDYDYVEARHDGYRGLSDPVMPTRRIIFIKPVYFIIIDEMECQSEHRVERRFQFKDPYIKIDSEKRLIHSIHESGPLLEIYEPISTAPFEWTAIKTKFSPEYNLLMDNITAINTFNINGFSSKMNVLFPRQENELGLVVETIAVKDRMHHSVETYYAEGFKITFKENGDEHLVLVVHHSLDSGVDAFYLDGTLVYGEVVLIKRENDNEEIIRIK